MSEPGQAPSFPPAQRRAGSPWLTIWLEPRPTLRRILRSDPNRGVYLLGALTGIVQCLFLARILAEAVDWRLGPAWVALLVLGGGPVAGTVGLHVRTALLRLTSFWLGGSADWRQVRVAVAWASVPVAAPLAIWVPMILILRGTLFEPGLTERVLQQGVAMLLPWLGLDLLQLACGAWSFVLLIRFVGEAEGLSAWRALGAIVLAGCLVGGAVVAAILAALGLAAAV